MPITKNKSIIIFDGICNLCNSSVQFLLKHDKKERFLFVSFQSDAAKKILLQYNYTNTELSSIILLQEGILYKKSTAALRIARQLNFFWSLSYIFIILPKGFRDFIYDINAKNRYQWFGKRDSCIVDNGKYKSRFIES